MDLSNYLFLILMIKSETIYPTNHLRNLLNINI